MSRPSSPRPAITPTQPAEAAPFGAYAPRGFARWAVDMARRLPDTWVSRRVIILLRRIATARLRGQPVDAEALGARFRLHPYNNICEKRMLFSPSSFDADELAILAERLEPGFVFIDIGANVGAYSLFVAARTGAAARILAVEPQPGIFDRLSANIRLNRFATIKAIACAVADKTGDLTLFLDPKNSGESSIKIVGSGAAESITVPAKTLLDLAVEEGIGRIDAIKLDVEGAEDIILEPFLREAPRALWPRLLILEDGTRQWGTDLPAILRQNGYVLKARTRLNFVFDLAPTA